jgi:hypothetical protein
VDPPADAESRPHGGMHPRGRPEQRGGLSRTNTNASLDMADHGLGWPPPNKSLPPPRPSPPPQTLPPPPPRSDSSSLPLPTRHQHLSAHHEVHLELSSAPSVGVMTRARLSRLRRAMPSPPPACSDPNGCARTGGGGPEAAGATVQPDVDLGMALHSGRDAHHSRPPPPALLSASLQWSSPGFGPPPPPSQPPSGIRRPSGRHGGARPETADAEALRTAGAVYQRLPAALRGSLLVAAALAAAVLLLVCVVVQVRRRVRVWQREKTYRTVVRMYELSD